MGEIPRFYSNQENSEVTSLLGDALPASTFSSHAAAALGDEPLSLVTEESHSVDSGLEEESWLEDDATGSSQEALDVGESDEDIFLDEEIDDAAPLADNPAALADNPEAALEADAEIASAEPISANESELDDFDSLLPEATGDAGVETPEAELEGFDELVDEETASDQDSEESAPDDPFAGLETADVPLEAAQAGAPAGDDDISNMWDEALAEQDAAEKADVEQGLGDVSSEMPDVQDEPESVSDEGELAELDDSDLESLWDEALEGSGDDDAVLDELSMEQEGESKADNEEEGESKADNEEESGSHELPAEGGDVVGQDDLDIEEGTDSGDDDEVDDEDFEPSGAADPLDDDGEIEAFTEDGDEEDEPVAAGARPEEEVREHFEETDAPFQNRLIAGLVDTLLVGFLAILFAVGTHFIIAKMVDSVYGNPESLAMVMAIDLVVLFLLSFFYAVYFIGGWGATPGLRTAGLVVVDLENRPVGYMQVVLRYFGTLAAVLPAGLGQILIVIDKRGRGLGDRLAGTKVILRASL
jgi:uncharacterized RDD family membrane protein YckC